MKARMLSILGWIRHQLAPAPSAPSRPRKRPARGPSRFDALERREVLSSATFSPFATLPGQVITAGQSAQVNLHFSAGQIASSQASTVLVGFYVTPINGSTAIPQVSEVDGPTGALTRVSLPKRDHSTPSKSLFITYLPVSPTAAEDVTVKVIEPGKQVGSFALEAFLPGDANATGSVDQADLALVQSSYGTSLGQANNNPAADFNADGHVGCIDLRLTQMNQGAQVTYGAPVAAAATPVVTTTAPVVSVQSVAVAATVPVASTAAVAVPVVQYVPVLTYPSPQTSGVSSSIAPSPTTPTYYYGQPVVQAPGYVQATTTTTAATPTYYYGQPVVQSPSYAPATAATPTYYYGQPVAQTAGYTQATTSPTPVYYYTQPVA